MPLANGMVNICVWLVSAMAPSTMVQNRRKHSINSHPTIYCSTSKGMSEQTSERSVGREQSEQGKASKRVSGASEQANRQAIGPILLSGFLVDLAQCAIQELLNDRKKRGVKGCQLEREKKSEKVQDEKKEREKRRGTFLLSACNSGRGRSEILRIVADQIA